MKTIYRATTGIRLKTYYHTDYKGTLRIQSDSVGNPVGGVNEYYPYGEFMVAGAASLTKRYYAGGESDNMGYTHLGARYYDPALGRFLTPDPIESAPATYVYALDNPIMFVDPSGLQADLASYSTPQRPKSRRSGSGVFAKGNRVYGIAMTPEVVSAAKVWQSRQPVPLTEEEQRDKARRANNKAIREEMDAAKYDPFARYVSAAYVVTRTYADGSISVDTYGPGEQVQMDITVEANLTMVD